MTLTEFYNATETRIEKSFPTYTKVIEADKEKLETTSNTSQYTLWSISYMDTTSIITLSLSGMSYLPIEVKPTLCVEFKFINKTDFFGETSQYFSQFRLPFIKEEDQFKKEETSNTSNLIEIKLNPSREDFLPTETEEYISFKRYLEYTEKFRELITSEVEDFSALKEFSPFGNYSFKENYIKGYPFVDEENLIAFKVDSSRGTIEGINYLSEDKATIFVENYRLRDIDDAFKNEIEYHLKLTPKEIVTLTEEGIIKRISRALNVFSLESTKGEILNKKEERKKGTEDTYVVSDYIGKYFK